MTIYPHTQTIAELAGKINGEQTALKIFIPYTDLLIGPTTLSLNSSGLTGNVRHFHLIPGLDVISL